MKIRFDKVGVEPTNWQETVEIDAASFDRADLVGLTAIDWSGSIRIEQSGFPLEARAKYEQKILCDRCLEPIIDPVISELKLLVLNRESDAVEGEIELDASDLEVLYCPGDTLDTSRILREQIELNVPMRALCKDGCLGLCPQCGQNRNESSCDCEAPTDPRWEVLRGLKS